MLEGVRNTEKDRSDPRVHVVGEDDCWKEGVIKGEGNGSRI